MKQDESTGYALRVKGFSSAAFLKEVSQVLISEAITQYGYTTNMVFAYRIKSKEMDTAFSKRSVLKAWQQIRRVDAYDMQEIIGKSGKQGRLSL